MAAVARARPEAIRAAISARPGDSYDVSLYIDERGGHIREPAPPRTVTCRRASPRAAAAQPSRGWATPADRLLDAAGVQGSATELAAFQQEARGRIMSNHAFAPIASSSYASW
jgi:hypothetical protein